MNEPSELSKRIAAEVHEQWGRRGVVMTSDTAAIIASHIAPLESELAAAKAEAERLAEALDENWVTHQRVVKAEAANATLRQQVEELRSLLNELHTMVWGECPSLLNEDSGGSAHLDMAINAALAATEPTSDGRG